MFFVHALRLSSGDELRAAIMRTATEMDSTARGEEKDAIAAAAAAAAAAAEKRGSIAVFLLTCVGSVRSGTLRLAGAAASDADAPHHYLTIDSPHEIVSLVGTACADGCHLHASLADARGGVIGGHVVELVVHTTAEIVLGAAPALLFSRELDGATGFKELRVRKCVWE